MTPVVALVGRPNVGKSTLFNRLTRSRDALVADFPGLTRDRKYGQAVVDDMNFIVVDTGGIDGSEEGIEVKMAEQSLQAIDESDVVLFMVDARAGVTSADIGIANHLRRQKKKVFLVANKTDGLDGDAHCADFYSLALGEVYQIAASHGRGVTSLLEKALAPFFEELTGKSPEEEAEDEDAAYWAAFEGTDTEVEAEEDEFTGEDRYADLPIKFAIIGRPNVGKSTLTNRMLGEDRVIVFDLPGTTRDSIYIPLERDEQQYIVIDTAGVRKKKKIYETVEKFSVVKTLQAIEDANVVLLLIDAREGVSDQDLSLLGFTLHSGRSIVIAVNKWDAVDDYQRQLLERSIETRLAFLKFASLHFISAKKRQGLGPLWTSIAQAHRAATCKMSTPVLTRLLLEAVQFQSPKRAGMFRPKMRYAHQGGMNPPVIVIHGNSLEHVTDAYKRFLEGRFRKEFDLVGTPLRIEMKTSHNPFVDKDEA
jgi:GTP-binding protein